MGLYEIRRKRLRQLIDERFDGVNAKLAEAMQWPATDLSRFFVKGKHGRNISERKARELERKCRVGKYWLDQPESAPLTVQQPLPVYNIAEDEQARLIELYSYLTPEQQNDIINRMAAYHKANEAVVKHLTGRFKTVTNARAAEKLPPAPKEPAQ